jgi:retron-type reverse transcriptase
MVAHRIADPVILGLIGKWLNAGAMQNGVVIYAEEGTPQGGPISPVLSIDTSAFQIKRIRSTLNLFFRKKINFALRHPTVLLAPS